ncbi:TPA: hypothetical protein HA278_07105, partial [Candidatus Woesearchaeota archaeon]|nr:hypothetical protein [Candidatus Woesearchaeota archaeon]
CGQVLYRRLTTNGELEARVSFDDSFNELMFDYHYSSSMAVPGFYFTIFFELQEDGTFKQDTDAGVVIQDEKGLRRISYLNSHLNTIAKLSELDQRAIYGFLLYDSITKGNPTEFFYSDHERETKLASMRNICEDPTNKHINYAKYTTKLFDLLYDQSSTHASRFLDFEIFMSSSFIECPSLADFRSLARTTISVENETIARFLHMGVALREIATVALATDALASQQKLCQELAHRTGKPYVAIPPSLFVDLLTDLGSNSIWQSTDS